MEDLIRADLIQSFLCVNCIEPVKQESVATDGSRFMVRLKIIFEQGYRFFRRHGTPPYCWLVRSLGGRDYNQKNGIKYVLFLYT